MAQSIPNVPTPPLLGHLSGICHLVGLGGEEFFTKPLPGGGAFINSSRSGKHRFFFNISHYGLKQYVWFSLHHHPTPRYFLHPSKKLLPIIVIVNASFEEFKGKDTFSLSEWLIIIDNLYLYTKLYHFYAAFPGIMSKIKLKYSKELLD